MRFPTLDDRIQKESRRNSSLGLCYGEECRKKGAISGGSGPSTFSVHPSVDLYLTVLRVTSPSKLDLSHRSPLFVVFVFRKPGSLFYEY